MHFADLKSNQNILSKRQNDNNNSNNNNKEGLANKIEINTLNNGSSEPLTPLYLLDIEFSFFIHFLCYLPANSTPSLGSLLLLNP